MLHSAIPIPSLEGVLKIRGLLVPHPCDMIIILWVHPIYNQPIALNSHALYTIRELFKSV